MADQAKLEKAKLLELDDGGQPVEGSTVQVQFNPETLKVSYANQVVPPNNTGATDTRGTSATQFVGTGTTKLSVQLWFDVTSTLDTEQSETDVRKLTKKVVAFITPKPSASDKTQNVPPAVRFLWGTFQFDGIMDSLDESLEFFSPEGRPLRASITLSLSQQKIAFAIPEGGAPAGKPGASILGTQPLVQVQAGANLQNLASQLGKGADWQSIASANGIENPRLIAPGQLIDMNVNAPTGK